MPNKLKRIDTKEKKKFGQQPSDSPDDEWFSADEPVHNGPSPLVSTNASIRRSVDGSDSMTIEQQEENAPENNLQLLKNVEELDKEDRSEFLKSIQNDHKNIHEHVVKTLRISLSKMIKDYTIDAAEKFKLLPSQYCSCNRCPVAQNVSEAFCCQSTVFKKYNHGRSHQCVTTCGSFENIIVVIRNECDKKETQTSEIMKKARADAYTEIANVLYGRSIDRTKRPRVIQLIPACVRKAVRLIFPDPDDHYEGTAANQLREQSNQLLSSKRQVLQEEQNKMLNIIDRFDVKEMLDLLQLFGNEDDPHNHFNSAFGKIIRYLCRKHPSIVEAKLKLMTPHGYCQCGECSVRENSKEAFCCKSTKFIGYNVSRPNICVTLNEDIKNIIDDRHKQLEKEEKNAQVMSNARGQTYTEIANKLYGIYYNCTQNPRNHRDIPSCVREVVRRAFPDPNGNYSGRDTSSSSRHT